MRSIQNARGFNGGRWEKTGGIKSWACWRRPRSYWDVAVHHLPLAAISAGALLLPHIATPGQLPLIPCTFLRLTGWPCPFCGFTRSFWALSTGHWSYALANCPLALGIFLWVVLMFLWNGAALVFGVVLQRGPMLQLPPALRPKMTRIVILLFLLNWFYRLAAGLT
jgi:Protein of unknown function (DUF2752)